LRSQSAKPVDRIGIGEERTMRRLDPDDLWVCPACHGQFAREDRFLICEECGRRYPIDEHGIPHLLISEGDRYRIVKDQPQGS
jgi:uncharacterized protein YbaR (Trm112 family)